VQLCNPEAPHGAGPAVGGTQPETQLRIAHGNFLQLAVTEAAQATR
jgi:hypothetical protein